MSLDVDVAIIGAGVAGLSAAKEAERLSLGHKVLEASDRIGGRAYSQEIAPWERSTPRCLLSTSNKEGRVKTLDPPDAGEVLSGLGVNFRKSRRRSPMDLVEAVKDMHLDNDPAVEKKPLH